MVEWAKQLAGKLLVFDGGDGSGKTTQFGRFADWCREQGLEVVETREPGGTAIGEQIRRVLLDPANTDMTTRCEMLLYMASRAQLVEQVMRPALERGALLLADRFVSSTLAYQGTAGGLDREDILSVAKVAVGATCPDLTVIFDVDETTAAERIGAADDHLSLFADRMERKQQAFHQRVREGYLEQARTAPAGTYALVDATADADAVFERLLAAIEARFASAT